MKVATISNSACQELRVALDYINSPVFAIDWYSLQGDRRYNGGQLGGAPALHQHHGLFHLHLVVEGDELRLCGTITCDQPLLHIGFVEAVQPEYSRKINRYFFASQKNMCRHLQWFSVPPAVINKQKEEKKKFLGITAPCSASCAKHMNRLEIPPQGTESMNQLLQLNLNF